MYAIDPHTGSPEHRKRYGEDNTVDEFKKNIKMARDLGDPVSFIFIDGAHAYEAAKLKFDLWLSQDCKQWSYGLSTILSFGANLSELQRNVAKRSHRFHHAR